ncbi:MAG: sodium:calcium antiporter [Gammaproteobacteria bacterium HGW-Gammaproteobacteria-11]|nr:MAG: sodium:calcium antiporter [Gammaproteobacteria bacterium HGW-Gammaproteobacteria-11]
MSPMVLVLFVVGLVLLVVGAELLVKGAARVAASFRISPLVIGLTVVAFGTSAPEMAVSVNASVSGQGDIALGNVVGSNIFNVLFILGLSALIAPLVVSRQLIRLDVPIMIGASLLVLLLALDGRLGRLDGALLFVLILAYTAFLIISSRRENQVDDLPEDKAAAPVWLNALWIVIGLVMLVLGARWLVNGAVSMALSFGVSERVVALTIVAAGTSLPEVATSVMASIRGQRDIAVGNVIGSNIFNLLAVLGLAALVAPSGVVVSEAVLRFDLLVMLAVAIACLPIFISGMRIGRWEALLFLGYFILYTLHVVTSGTANSLPGLGSAVVFYLLPLTAVTLVLILLRDRLRNASGKS